MLVLNLLRELDVLLCHALDEAACNRGGRRFAWRMPAVDRLAALHPACRGAVDHSALCELAVDRRRMARGWRAASSGRAPVVVNAAAALSMLLAAATLYTRLSTLLAREPGRPSSQGSPDRLIAIAAHEGSTFPRSAPLMA